MKLADCSPSCYRGSLGDTPINKFHAAIISQELIKHGVDKNKIYFVEGLFGYERTVKGYAICHIRSWEQFVYDKNYGYQHLVHGNDVKMKQTKKLKKSYFDWLECNVSIEDQKKYLKDTFKVYEDMVHSYEKDVYASFSDDTHELSNFWQQWERKRSQVDDWLQKNKEVTYIVG